ncbi:MAG: hypothetical protein KDE31_31025, partial [Caldilineaceae bacterium]|nr:hypothetical protein [Caldilineaceae bacterium]
PSLSASDIRNVLRTAAYPINEPPNYVGRGRLDLQAALRAILPPSLSLSATSFVREVTAGAEPYTVTLRLDNPSSAALDWRAELTAGAGFVNLHGASNNVVSGTVSYGAPAYLALTISPNHLMTGSHAATLQVTELLADGVQRQHPVDLTVAVGSQQALLLYYVPLAPNVIVTATTAIDYSWEIPSDPNTRSVYQFGDDSITVSLPFTFTLFHPDDVAVRVYADGFLRFPANVTTDKPQDNYCLSNLIEPDQAIYGWWANLDPSALGARVSSFQPDADRFVIEFANVPSAAGVTPAYQVSFQIVLYRNGAVRLNYREAPGLTAAAQATVGITGRDGLFFNQVACNDGSRAVGYLPQAQQSLFFHGQGDIY